MTKVIQELKVAKEDAVEASSSNHSGQSSSGPFGRPIKKIAASPLTWLVCLLILFDIGIDLVKPLRFVKIPGVLLKDQDPIDYRIESLLKPAKPANVYLLGTSLADSAAANGDALNLKLKLTEYERGRYIHAHYFDNLMNEKLGIQSCSINVGIGGSMVSGAERILETALKDDKNRKKPGLVVLMVAPRAFIDATRSPELYPVECYFQHRFKGNSKEQNWIGTFQNELAKRWTFFDLRSDYATVLTKAACAYFDRPENAYQKVEEKLPRDKARDKIELSFKEEYFDPSISARPDWVNSVSAYYSSAYGKEIDKNKLKTQLDSFARSLRLLKEKEIPALIVSMPLSKHNRNQIPGDFEKEYRSLLYDLSSRYDTRLIYMLDSPAFDFADYRDSVHLNGRGATRFWDLLVEQMGDDPSFLKIIKTTLK